MVVLWYKRSKAEERRKIAVANAKLETKFGLSG
jgi:hypothetical protein